MDTGSTVFHFFCFMMALNPDVQTKCQNEIDLLFSLYSEECRSGNMTMNMTNNYLQYLERCILETLRLFPPVFAFGRNITSPLRIQHDGKHFEIPTGTNILCSPYLLQRNPEYFPDPEKFDPDRFLPTERETRPPYSYIPFSPGIRNCIGVKFAVAELQVLAAYTLKNFFIETADTMEDICLLPLITLMAEKDMRFRFRKRL